MNNKSTRNNRSVRFDQVFVHEYPLIMGDNPAVSKGAPLTIGWKPMTHDVIDLDIYEYLREPERRHRKRMILSNSKRAKILMNAGYTIDEIAEMTLQVEDAKRVRADNALEAEKLMSGNTAWANFKNMNITDLLSGAAEGTGRTLVLVRAAPTAVLKATSSTGQAVGKVLVKGTKGTGKAVVTGGKVATDVVVGTGKLGYNVVATTGKVTTDIARNSVKGTGKVVVGASKATVAGVVGTGKLGFDVVKNTGKRMSKLMSFNESATRELSMFDEHVSDSDFELGYEDADEPAQEQQQQRNSDGSSAMRWARRGSNDGTNNNKRDSVGKGTPAPQRMSRRASANASVSGQVASRTSGGDLKQLAEKNQEKTQTKAKRRGSGNNARAALGESFSNFTNFVTRGVRRTSSSTGDAVSGGRDMARRTRSSDSSILIPGSKPGRRRRRATMNTGETPSQAHRSKSASHSASVGPGGEFSDLAQMEEFINYVRGSDPSTVNPIIGNAYYKSSDHDSDDDEDDHHYGGRSATVDRIKSAPESNRTPLPQTALTAETMSPVVA